MVATGGKVHVRHHQTPAVQPYPAIPVHVRASVGHLVSGLENAEDRGIPYAVEIGIELVQAVSGQGTGEKTTGKKRAGL